jgi:hypothetical protein
MFWVFLGELSVVIGLLTVLDILLSSRLSRDPAKLRLIVFTVGGMGMICWVSYNALGYAAISAERFLWTPAQSVPLLGWALWAFGGTGLLIGVAAIKGLLRFRLRAHQRPLSQPESPPGA